MIPRWQDSWRQGAQLGALCGAIGTAGILAGNARTINLSSALVIAGPWLAAGILAGAGAATLGARGFAILRWHPRDGAIFLATVVAGALLLPSGYGLAGGAGLWLLRLLRRRVVPQYPRLDGLAILLVACLGLNAAVDGDHPRPPTLSPQAPLAHGAPLPASVPVTVSIHPAPDFPEVAAIHVPLRPLAATLPGRMAALWSGRAPARTRIGPRGVRTLPGGGALTNLPQSPAALMLLPLLTRGEAGNPNPRQLTGSLPALAEAAGIPVLCVPPEPSDPALFLRILEQPAAPGRSLAEELQRTGAWIDVTLGPRSEAEIALSGRGIALTRAGGDATLMDVAPTALHLLGLAIPRGCDGRLLHEYMDPAGPGARTPRYCGLRAATANAATENQEAARRP